ncbi:Negative regulator of mitosis [Escovopsis weberi]|uniref:Negative regulator of mitosis n=1 Tax=Escovopsis weberi TaxID=150374 RepID=A0A0M8N1M4_ESCWE|nr:Negative regulator of mitosis [Escovopsis weberi]
MASVQSLGLHRPSGLQHAIDEQLLPADAPPSSYTWEIFPDGGNGRDEIEDELLVTENCVLWSRGGMFRKTFKFDLEKEPITQALLTYFPASEDEKKKKTTTTTTKKKKKKDHEDRHRDKDKKRVDRNDESSLPGYHAASLQRALVVFLKTQAHIYMLSGTSHVVHMPFQVESACAAPVGVIMQTKQRAENMAPIALKFPRVPPNSFVSSHMTAFDSSQPSAFSVEGLGRPKPLHFSLGSTLENMWDAPLEQPESRWPRLVCLTDPLLDIGLVVTNTSSGGQGAQTTLKKSSKNHRFLNSAEEILHIEQIQVPGISPKSTHEPVILAVTVNREKNSYSIWRLSYLELEDPFIKRHKLSSTKSLRRRSSMQPGFASGTSTPVQSSHRDSFGAPLPGRKLRKSERFEKPLDLVSTLEKQDREVGSVTRRSSRRLSSMLARADLSASYDRSVFPEQPGVAGNMSSKRHDSLGGGRTSSIFNHQVHPSLSSLLETPLDESFHSIKLDDHEFDGLQHEVLFTRLHTVPVDSSNLRYSISSQPARSHSKVFILIAPPFATDDHQNGQILVSIQEPAEKRLQLITLYLKVQQRRDMIVMSDRSRSSRLATVTILPGDLRRAHNVVDSCRIVDGDQTAILVLSESVNGRHELSHLMLAKEYMGSAFGENALGPNGYLPTSIGKSPDTRRKMAVDIFMALHLLLEEQKLDIMSPEFAPAGRADYRVIMCQISRWLGWQGFSATYELGIQEDIDPSNDGELTLKNPIPEPHVKPDVLEWIQSRLVGHSESHRWDPVLPRTLMFKRFFKLLKPDSTAVEMVEAMHDCGLTSHVLDTLPEATPTHTASWDFKMLCESVDQSNNQGYDEGEGTERQAVIRALFKDDRRLNEVQDLLSTHKPRIIRIDQDPGLPESDYLEKQKEVVSRIATGTMAIPAGRGLLYYSLRFPLITQKLHIGGFNLNCIVRPSNVTVGVDKSLFTEEKAKGIDTSWILYNKPGQELSNRHAGFLLALGLNGHLRGVAKWVAFKYLTPKHTMTSIGLLLGLAASYMGTMDSLITRLLSVHATRMLPRGAAELNLSPLTQTSGIMGIGLLYCGSQHRRMSEIMLSEIEHVEDENEEEPLRNECYRLAAGFALGYINLGKGGDLKGLHDMRLTEKLITHATATKNVEIVHVLDRASAGAVMAIALIFMKSEDQIVARKIDVPSSVMQFDYVRPDILLLRTLAKNLILWSKIEPNFAWIQSSLPTSYRSRHKLQATTKLRSTDLPFFSILTGVCFSIALRFSGSASLKVRDLLLHYLDQFMRITSLSGAARSHPEAGPSYDEELARTNARMCQDVLAVSCAIVMAGTGDIPVLRRLRALHGRDDPDTPYGSHLAAHLAIGALFLGCGTATFGTDNKSIASLLVAFYPIFPVNVMDNRAHLQAFRHFWVLAAEQRCLVARDTLTGQPVSIPVHIRMQQGSSADQVLARTTPCLLPPLDQISSVSTACGPQFWDVKLDFSNEEVRKTFAQRQNLYLRRRSPREGAFTSTLRALGEDSKRENPLAWVLDIDGLQGLSYAEKAAVLDTGDEEHGGIGGSVDAVLEMEHGIAEGGDRERLEGVRLLFEWANVRDRLRPRTFRDPDVSVDEDGLHHEVTALLDDDDAGDAEGSWWIRDSAIEALKGKVWLAAQESEQ